MADEGEFKCCVAMFRPMEGATHMGKQVHLTYFHKMAQKVQELKLVPGFDLLFEKGALPFSNSNSVRLED